MDSGDLHFKPLDGITIPPKSYRHVILYSDWSQIYQPIDPISNEQVIFIQNNIIPGSIRVPDGWVYSLVSETPSLHKQMIGRNVTVDGKIGRLSSVSTNSCTNELKELTIMDDEGKVLIISKPKEIITLERVYYTRFPRLILERKPGYPIDSSSFFSYLTKKLYWKSYLTGVLRNDMLYINIQCEIINNTDTTLLPSQMTLISGDIHGSEYSFDDTKTKKDTDAEIVKYEINAIPIGKGNTQLVIGKMIVPYKKLYIHKLGDKHANVTIQFIPNEHIPESYMYFYSDEGYYIGGGQIKKTKQGNSVEVEISENAINVKSTLSVTNNRLNNKEWNIITTNPYNTPINLIVRREINDNESKFEPLPSRTIDDIGIHEWSFLASPGDYESKIIIRQ